MSTTPVAATVLAEQWLTEQLKQQRELFLLIDSLAEPNPVVELFTADLMQSYSNLYLGTEFSDMAEVGPWLVHLSQPNNALIQTLLQTPERHWGWLASAARSDIASISQHWRERMLIDEQTQRSLYRFQDNRVIARHLAQLSAEQRPLLLGPLASALCWDGQAWQSFENPKPALYPAPFAKPWQELAEPEAISADIQRHNLEQWLWQEHSAATAELAETHNLSTWLDEQLVKAKQWDWHAQERIEFLLSQQLDPIIAADKRWAPLPAETADSHFERCRKQLSTVLELQV
ncbi:DUF4123 domain-containing protein [Pseudomonas sp. 5P_3.1_Bac2]|uniref:DUF4123 domain-containing protein n=1 Tax=Pseudomonas sp. 5P_3.1_Bac2 TaxID=2971617 RepID=UPI0021C7B0F0|nr:DUF4123 domain-containing protein [Pseudomonas sp. 5P_3.1_Bac2]MCU1718973.1 DUF4123 domain-containing protein [Pseudomonas sp. 5P_3.1_Bac2]